MSEVLYLTACRDSAAKSLGNIPYKDQPTTDTLEGYVRMKEPLADLAWGPQYAQLCSWLSDYAVRQKENAELEESKGDSAFNYRG